jgi:hypothetical protein
MPDREIRVLKALKDRWGTLGWVGVGGAIGIEPMNKGFAETDYVFAQVLICSLVPIAIGVSDVSCLRMIRQMRACCDW